MLILLRTHYKFESAILILLITYAYDKINKHDIYTGLL